MGITAAKKFAIDSTADQGTVVDDAAIWEVSIEAAAAPSSAVDAATAQEVFISTVITSDLVNGNVESLDFIDDAIAIEVINANIASQKLYVENTVSLGCVVNDAAAHEAIVEVATDPGHVTSVAAHEFDDKDAAPSHVSTACGSSKVLSTSTQSYFTTVGIGSTVALIHKGGSNSTSLVEPTTTVDVQNREQSSQLSVAVIDDGLSLINAVI
ncbi:hypothetical protein ACH5RR_007914 [Cinchona calisaya]|uniref:Uncharacterized protein n=1 Tax=Cinchona calisaya TaxID=153742 RepID=A0ABD3ACT8_9GENT